LTTNEVVILGGYGYTGRTLAPLLLQHSTVSLKLAGRNLDAACREAARLNGLFPGERVKGIRADASDASSLRAVFRGARAVAVCSSTPQHALQVARAALDEGLDYIDIQLSPRKLKDLAGLRPDIEKAGRCFVTDGGFHPGLAAFMVKLLAPKFDAMEKARVASLLKNEEGLPYTGGVDELMEMFRDYSADVLAGGHWTHLTLMQMKPYRADFGVFGRRDCYPMHLEELKGLPALVPSLQDCGFYVAGWNWFSDVIVTPLILAGLWLFPKSSVRPLGRLLSWSTRHFNSPPYGVLLKCFAEGKKNGQPLKMGICLSHPDAYVFTAAPVAACLLQMLERGSGGAGLHFQALWPEPERMLKDLMAMGIRREEELP
jgi:saccharopine dehydrogenase-like NADP-dependent oxidoreductase